MVLLTSNVESYDEIFDNKDFRFTKRLQKLTGIWPYETRRKIKYWGFISASLFVTPMINGIFTYYGQDKNNFIECTVETIFVVQFLVVYSAIFCSRNTVRQLFDVIAENWILIKNDAEHQILNDFAKEGRVKANIIGVFITIAVTLFNALPPTIELFTSLVANQSHAKWISIKGDYFIDQQIYYYPISIYNIIFSFTSSVIILAMISFYFTVLYQCCAFFKLVRYAQVLEDSCSTTFFVLIGVIILVMSNIAAAILFTNDFKELLTFTLYEISLLAELLVLSCLGELIINSSSQVYVCAYDTDWFRISCKSQKLIQLMIMRSTRPCVLTVGGLYILNFENFLNVLKTAVSYITIMASARDELK